MKFYLKHFFLRGFIAAGFGPIVVGIVYATLEQTLDTFSLGGAQVLIAIVSSYFLAFVQAGATVFNQIENWSPAKSLVFHFSSLYVAYVLCYLTNSWIPFRADVLLIFTAVFVSLYLCIWFSVYLTAKITKKNLNKKLKL